MNVSIKELSGVFKCSTVTARKILSQHPEITIHRLPPRNKIEVSGADLQKLIRLHFQPLTPVKGFKPPRVSDFEKLQWISTDELAAEMGCHRSIALARLRRQGVPALRLLHKLRISRTDADRLIALYKH